MPARATFESGVFHLDGKPAFLLSADYAYYRDRREHWRTRLEAIGEAGVRVVTTYLPWRHHAPSDPLRGGGSYDFDGRTQANRDVIGFLRLCEELDLLAIVKPGPFVHAELRYGGLPDYVDPGSRGDIEPERDGAGEPFRWHAPGGGEARALPAPLDDVFCQYADDWLSRVGREVIAPNAGPQGPIVAVQVLNEGIYSDSASGLIPNYGYSASSKRAWARFLHRTYGTIQRYNALHATSHEQWQDVPAPVAVAPSNDARAMLTYLDRSRFFHALYADVLRRCVGALHAAGVDRELPMLMNFCPNVNAFRSHVASNDGWYSKVAWHPALGVHWGYTDWIGVAARDPRAYQQYVLCATRERGPNVEQNWGLSDIYDPAYASVQPSYFESVLSIAAGATGLNVYAMVGTQAWRDDHNIDTVGLPSGDYPRHAPVTSDGARSPKYWTIAQLAHHLASEGASLVGDRRADVAWAVYPPYAWAGAWAPSGADEEGPWMAAGFRAMPHVTYRGLEAFLESAGRSGMDVAQLNVMDADAAGLSRYRCLVLSGYDFMDAETQRKLVAFVEGGGALVLTGLLPTRDEHLAPMDRHPLRDLFGHRGEQLAALPPDRLTRILRASDGRAVGLAQGWVLEIDPAGDATDTLGDDKGRCVGAIVRRGRGLAIHVGFQPWFSALHGDDMRLVDANAGILESLLAGVRGVRLRYASATTSGAHEVDVWQYGAFRDAEVEHLAIVSRVAMPDVREVTFTRRNGAAERIRLALVPHSACLATFERGRARSILLKCVNDHDGVAVPPYLEEPGGEWLASAPCDLCVTRTATHTVEIAVAHAAREAVDVSMPIQPDAVEGVVDAAGRLVDVEPTPGGVRVRVRDMRLAGIHRLRLRAARPRRVGE